MKLLSWVASSRRCRACTTLRCSSPVRCLVICRSVLRIPLKDASRPAPTARPTAIPREV